MDAFEKFLVEKGYKVSHMNHSTMKREDGYLNISTLVNLSNEYEKDGVTICYGLYEANKPPTLIGPRPIPCWRIEPNTLKDGKFKTCFGVPCDDDIMNQILRKVDFEIILKHILNRNICFSENLLK